ncbi:hypothetical protein DINM_002199 [Dirofilaria immitis]|nr:hypothetical protein [Dirofilaria immitis]
MWLNSLCPMLKQEVNKPTAISSKPSLSIRSKHLLMEEEHIETKILQPQFQCSASETCFTLSNYDNKNSDFTASEICQASSSQQTELLDIFEPITEKKIPEFKKSLQNIYRNDAVDKAAFSQEESPWRNAIVIVKNAILKSESKL